VGFVKKNKYEIGIIFLIVLRGILNAIVPLMDKTEARYAEIARIMQETNNYITPQIDYGVPFWAKPPLSTWLSALSMEVFGVNEFAVRLPYLLATIFFTLYCF
jgi:4-amino-4-deoxy-L-arabinose transferase-like glycosyltransferase